MYFLPSWRIFFKLCLLFLFFFDRLKHFYLSLFMRWPCAFDFTLNMHLLTNWLIKWLVFFISSLLLLALLPSLHPFFIPASFKPHNSLLVVRNLFLVVLGHWNFIQGHLGTRVVMTMLLLVAGVKYHLADSGDNYGRVEMAIAALWRQGCWCHMPLFQLYLRCVFFVSGFWGIDFMLITSGFDKEGGN